MTAGRKRDILRKPKHTHWQTDRQADAQTNPLQEDLIWTTRLILQFEMPVGNPGKKPLYW